MPMQRRERQTALPNDTATDNDALEPKDDELLECGCDRAEVLAEMRLAEIAAIEQYIVDRLKPFLGKPNTEENYEERYRQRVLSNLQRRAKAFGYVLQAAAPQAPQAVGVS
jgi:hypothetical protein